MEAKANRLMGNMVILGGIVLATILYIVFVFAVVIYYYLVLEVGLAWTIIEGLIMASPIGIWIWDWRLFRIKK